jgi:hypothetical protein
VEVGLTAPATPVAAGQPGLSMHRVRIEKSGSLFVDDLPLKSLARREAEMLEAVLRYRGVMATDVLMSAIYGDMDQDWPDSKVLHVFAAHIRRKLGDHAAALANVRGRGFQAGADYILDPPKTKVAIMVPTKVADRLAEVAAEADMDEEELLVELLRQGLATFRKRALAA